MNAEYEEQKKINFVNFRESIHNVGQLLVHHHKDFYKKNRATIFV